jgi:hypothetical protein
MFTQYDPGLVTVVVGGRTMIGFHSGSFVEVERDEDTWKKEKGSQGDGVRTRNRNKGGRITITLQSTSPSNADLMAIAADDENPFAFPSTVAAMVKYMGADGAVLWMAKDAWVLKPANSTFADEHSPREWVIDCDEILAA